jgi:hypothetical protein
VETTVVVKFAGSAGAVGVAVSELEDIFLKI